MQSRRSDSMPADRSGAVGNTRIQVQPLPVAAAVGDAGDDGWDDGWLQQVLLPIATRIRLPAQAELAAAKSIACHYLVVSGELLVVRHRAREKPLVRFMAAGDLFLVGGVDHAACAPGQSASISCHAILDSLLLRVEDDQLDALSRTDPRLIRILSSVAAIECRLPEPSPAADPACDMGQPNWTEH